MDSTFFLGRHFKNKADPNLQKQKNVYRVFSFDNCFNKKSSRYHFYHIILS